MKKLGLQSLTLSLGLALLPQLLFAQSKATESYRTPKLLTEKFYSKADVCADARTISAGKKAFALILLKTHLCDFGTGVCLSSFRSISDPANVWVHENFVTYHTRFFRYRGQNTAAPDAWEIIQDRDARSEELIRKEWDKDDVNPELLVMDLENCNIINRHYVYDNDTGFSKDRTLRNEAWIRLTLNDRVYYRLPNREATLEKTVAKFRARSKKLAARYPEASLAELHQSLDAQSSESQQELRAQKSVASVDGERDPRSKLEEKMRARLGAGRDSSVGVYLSRSCAHCRLPKTAE